MESWFLIRSIQTQQRWHTHFCVTAKLIPAARKTIFFKMSCAILKLVYYFVALMVLLVDGGIPSSFNLVCIKGCHDASVVNFDDVEQSITFSLAVLSREANPSVRDK